MHPFRRVYYSISCSIPNKLRFQCDFLPVDTPSTNDKDDIESELYKENSVLWNEILRKKEERMGVVESTDVPISDGPVEQKSEEVSETPLDGKNISDAAQDLETMLKTYGSDLNSLTWIVE